MRAGFPHSEICGSKLVCQLPAAYRRLLRPSSPVIAKASTTCTYSLDPITLHTTQRNQVIAGSSKRLPQFSVQIKRTEIVVYAITTRIQIKKTEYDIFFQIVKEQLHPKNEAQTAAYAAACASHLDSHRHQETGGGERDRTDDPLLAKQVLSQLSYTPSKTLVGLDGFEPSTPALSRRCSNRLSYRPSASRPGQ